MGVLNAPLLLPFFMQATAGVALQNITLALPPGTSDHGTPGLLCTPTKWTDLVTFYLFNYVAHAATVLPLPGERSIDFAATVIGSLLFPSMGLYRGVEAILSGVVFCGWNWKRGHKGCGDEHLTKAAKSGALCMLIRSREWRPADGEEIDNAVLRRRATRGKEGEQDDPESIHLVTYQPPWILSKFGCSVYVQRQTVHGTYLLPKGYIFAIVPQDAQFVNSVPAAKIEVAAKYNLVQAVVAIAQTAYASLTLYRARGDQIEQFGYAAFGLTVAPYAVMSIMNLLGNLCRPDYASLYMVESSIMDEARYRGGVFEGAIARVEEEKPPNVCGWSYAGVEDIKNLRFTTVHHGAIAATFNTPATLTYSSLTDEKSSNATSIRSSMMEKSVRLCDIPRNVDYVETGNDALLLVPSTNPLKRRASPSPVEDVACFRYRIENITLRKIHWSSKLRYWSVSFQPHATQTTHPLRWRLLKYLITTFISLLPLVINGAMSRFRSGRIPNSESSTWRSYTMQWLSMSLVTGLWWVLDQEAKNGSEAEQKWFGPRMRVMWYVISASPAVGGFIVVGQMISRYGNCSWMGS